MLRFLGVKDSENSVYIFFSVRVHVFQRPCTKICTYDIGHSTPVAVPIGMVTICIKSMHVLQLQGHTAFVLRGVLA